MRVGGFLLSAQLQKFTAGVLTVTGTSTTGVGVTVNGQFPTNLGAGGAFTISVL